MPDTAVSVTGVTDTAPGTESTNVPISHADKCKK